MMLVLADNGTHLHMYLVQHICSVCCLPHVHPVRWYPLFSPSTVFLRQVSILKRADLSTADIAQLADAVEPIAFADGELYPV